MKKFLLIVMTVFMVGCSSDDSSSSDTINMWDYINPGRLINILFDIIEVTNGETTSTEIGSLTHEYLYVSNSEVNGSWRDYEGVYNISNNGSYISFAPVEENPSYDWTSASFHTNLANGDFLYRSVADSGFSTTSSNIKSSLYITGGECVLNAKLSSITFLNNYTYEDVVEIKCESTRTQEYGEIGSTQTIVGADIFYEYYQKNQGWIAKVDKNCIVAIDGSYEFIDDESATCVKTYTKYILQSN